MLAAGSDRPHDSGFLRPSARMVRPGDQTVWTTFHRPREFVSAVCDKCLRGYEGESYALIRIHSGRPVPFPSLPSCTTLALSGAYRAETVISNVRVKS